MKFYIEAKKSEKTGNEFIALMAERVDKQIYVTIDVDKISRISGYSPRSLYLLEVGERIELNQLYEDITHE